MKHRNNFIKTRFIAGFTLIELLIVVAIIGILAGVGIPLYNGYIADSKETVAKNDIRSISLMQADFFSDNNTYYLIANSTSSTRSINTNLFGRTTLDVEGDYNYSVRAHDSGFHAVATPKSNTGLTKYCLTNLNDMNSGSKCP